MRYEFSRHTFEKFSNIKFHQNPSSGSRVVTWGQAYKTKLIVAFRNFANAPNNGHMYLFYQEVVLLDGQKAMWLLQALERMNKKTAGKQTYYPPHRDPDSRCPRIAELNSRNLFRCVGFLIVSTYSTLFNFLRSTTIITYLETLYTLNLSDITSRFRIVAMLGNYGWKVLFRIVYKYAYDWSPYQMAHVASLIH
jgi:hypothetical protein